MSYRVKEIFYTIQGEGYHAGSPALFLRFTGCNLWSGKAEDRLRDADRNGAKCPMWCDTDFVGGIPMTCMDIVEQLRREASCHHTRSEAVPLIVLTGGEPLLQLDAELCMALHDAFPHATLAVETNGTVEPKVPIGVTRGIDWICVSPKVPVAKLKLTRGNELKVVHPAYTPEDYFDIIDHFDHLYVSAEANTMAVGKSLVAIDNLRNAARWVMENPQWCLTLQAHKMIGLP